MSNITTTLDVTSAIFTAVIGGLVAGIATYIGFNIRLIKQGIELKQIKEQTERLMGDFTLQKLVDVHLDLKKQSDSLQNKIETLERDILVSGDKVHQLKTSKNFNEIKDILHNLNNQSINFDYLKKLIEITFKDPNNAIVDIQNKFSNFERQLNGIEIHKVRTGKYDINIGTKGRILQTGEGERTAEENPISFGYTFNHTPTVFVGISQIQSGYSKDEYKGNIIVEISTKDITKKDFKVVAKTYDKCNIYQLRISWIAFGK